MSVQQFIVTALNNVLPNAVYYELSNDKKTIPCITYIGAGDKDEIVPFDHTVGYGTTNYTIKIWAEDYNSIITYEPQVLSKMRELGFWEDGGNEITYNKLICRIINFKANTFV